MCIARLALLGLILPACDPSTSLGPLDLSSDADPHGDVDVACDADPCAALREVCAGTLSGDPASSIVVPVTIDNGDGVAGFQIDLGYDASLVAWSTVRLGADTAAAGGWTVSGEQLTPEQVRVLGYSTVAQGLGPGARELALVDFAVVAASPVADLELALSNWVVGTEEGVGIASVACP